MTGLLRGVDHEGAAHFSFLIATPIIIGATVLEVQRTYKLAGGKIAQVAINTHPASRFRHSMTMRRVKG